MAVRVLPCIETGMTVLDIIDRHQATATVFKACNERAGECICCQALFDTVPQVADRYGLALNQLIDELNSVANACDENQYPA